MKNEEALYQAKFLLKLAAKNRSEHIRKTLSSLKGTTKFKGDVFENFIAGLYKETGWTAQVTGGKNDKGVDILLYHPENPSKVEAIIQTKNLKTPLSTRDLRHEYSNFFGDNFSHSQSSSELYNCKKLILISFNGYTKDAKNFHHPHPETHQVIHQDWTDVKTLIEKYSDEQKPLKNQQRLKKPISVTFFSGIDRIKAIIAIAKENVAIIVIILVVVVFFLTDDMRNSGNKDENKDYMFLTNAMLVRLHEVKITKDRKTDCRRLRYSLETCPEQLVSKYMDKYADGNLETGLIIYFCGQGNFKKGKCGRHSKRQALYILTGN